METKKHLTLQIPEDLHYNFKVIATQEKTTMKALILKMIKNYCQKKCEEEYEFEELDEEDFKDLEEGDKAYAEGRYKTFEQVKEEFPCQ